MKAKIISVVFDKEYETKFGKLYAHRITYDDNGNSVSGFYSSKMREKNTSLLPP